MKKIGFVDYYISEWHANNYPVWIAEAAKNAGYDYKVSYAWAELDNSPVYNENTDQWCEKFGVEKCETIAELCEKSDVIIVLAPSNPETHLKYAKEVLPYGKPTYIDKTFAPDFATALEIFALAEKYNTPFFSSSALRYGEELDTDFECSEILTSGGGSNLPEYLVHQTEMVVKKLGTGATRVSTMQRGTQTHIYVDYPDNRIATMIYTPSNSFTAYMSNEDNSQRKYKKVSSDYFAALIADILRFFEEKTTSFDTKETLEVMKIREGVLCATEKMGEWIELSTLKTKI